MLAKVMNRFLDTVLVDCVFLVAASADVHRWAMSYDKPPCHITPTLAHFATAQRVVHMGPVATVMESPLSRGSVSEQNYFKEF